jgi:uncharacterized membrane protein
MAQELLESGALSAFCGSLATLIGAFFTWKLRNAHPFLAPVPPIVANTLVVPFVLKYAYMVDLPILLMMLTVCIGEILSCGVLGLILYYALRPHKERIFGNPETVGESA